jgi:phosphatidylglycerol:prolipoprotein diacylglycerol transferase
MTIDRFGCFFGGCRVGRPTASCFGLWSSDQRLGVRRIPIQLFESSLALCIAIPATLDMWATTPRPRGMVFIGTIAAYTLDRQLHFPLRDNPRKTAHGRRLAMATTGLIVFVVAAVGVFA